MIRPMFGFLAVQPAANGILGAASTHVSYFQLSRAQLLLAFTGMRAVASTSSPVSPRYVYLVVVAVTIRELGP